MKNSNSPVPEKFSKYNKEEILLLCKYYLSSIHEKYPSPKSLPISVFSKLSKDIFDDLKNLPSEQEIKQIERDCRKKFVKRMFQNMENLYVDFQKETILSIEKDLINREVNLKEVFDTFWLNGTPKFSENWKKEEIFKRKEKAPKTTVQKDISRSKEKAPKNTTRINTTPTKEEQNTQPISRIEISPPTSKQVSNQPKSKTLTLQGLYHLTRAFERNGSFDPSLIGKNDNFYFDKVLGHEIKRA